MVFSQEYNDFQSIPQEVVDEILKKVKGGSSQEDFINAVCEDFEVFFSDFMINGNIEDYLSSLYLYEFYTVKLNNYELFASSSSYRKDQLFCDKQWDLNLVVTDLKAYENYKDKEKEKMLELNSLEWFDLFKNYPTFGKLKEELLKYEYPKKLKIKNYGNINIK